ncbi:MAG: ABC transporter ATP-binding protein [candidate division Zixibacteria bacterium]|nr:ABC transporter ATP-binding protein [candidate division Zixibacteria bacterium]
MVNHIIKTSGLTKTFGDITAVDHLNLEVYEGEMFGIVGPDGAGKTTLIRMLCGVTDSTSGNAKIIGHDLQTELDSIKNNIGYLSQRFSLYGDLSIDENIEFFAEIHHVKDYHQRREELLEFTRLAPFRKRLADRLSGGMKQKLALACTLIHMPKIIFLDEPTTGVDPVSRRDFWKILSSLLKSGITIVMTTPYLDEAERCTRIGLMNNGYLMIADTPRNVKEKMKGTIYEVVCDKIRNAYSTAKDSTEIKEVQIFGDRLNLIVENPDEDRQSLLDIFKSKNIEITHIRIIPPTLENVFISLIKTGA